MTPEERAALRAEHEPFGAASPECVSTACDEHWPCNVTRLLDALDEAEAAGVRDLEREFARLRLGLRRIRKTPCGECDAALVADAVLGDALRPTAPGELYDPEADARRGDVIRSLVEVGLWLYAPDDSTDDAAWRGPLDDPTKPVLWLSSWDLPEHTVLVSRSVPVAQPATVPPATDTTAAAPTGDRP